MPQERSSSIAKNPYAIAPLADQPFLHEVKVRLQDHFGDGLLVVVGSGLSVAEGVPGMGELAAHLQTAVQSHLAPGDLPVWESVCDRLKDGHTLETALQDTPVSEPIEVAIATEVAKQLTPAETKIYSEVLRNERTLRFTRLLAHVLKPNTGVPVITTNYDRIIELAVEAYGMGVDTMFIGQTLGSLNDTESRYSFCRGAKYSGGKVRLQYRQHVKLYKPHGSLDWYSTQDGPVRVSVDLPLPRLMITPGFNKFRSGYNVPFDKHRERANREIDRATRYLIVGYGFNDDHLETHITPAIRSGKPTLILTRTLSENARKIVTSMSSALAIEHTTRESQEGCLLHGFGTRAYFAKFDWWELGEFISGVLEP